jgi:WhiB family redox-sensing transcriptional regulator
VIGRKEIPEWVSEGVCGQVDPEIMFPDKGGSTQDAKRLCMTCPVRVACLTWALDNDEWFGVWGGKSERERRALKPERVAA